MFIIGLCVGIYKYSDEKITQAQAVKYGKGLHVII